MYELKHAAAIAEVLPEGQKVTAFVLEYDREIRPEETDRVCFEIVDHSLEPELAPANRGIRRVYANSRPERGKSGEKGKYIILETDTACKEAYTIINYNEKGEQHVFGPGALGFGTPGGPGGPGKPDGPGAPGGAGKPDGPGAPGGAGKPDGPGAPGGAGKPDGPGAPGGAGKPGGPTAKMDYTGFKKLNYTICQKPTEGTAEELFSETEIICTESLCPEVERFQLCRYEELLYNLYIPAEYDPDRAYPLVLFIPDASARSTDPKIPLVQGIGGLIWSSPEDQKKHPCFVVCPVFAPEDLLTRDDFTNLPKVYRMKDLLDHVAEKYSVDKNRIYTTGQSMGCMSSCELMCTYPDYFAGAVLVAGQWDPVRCGKAMWNKPVWILVSANDFKAHPGMDAVTAAIEEQGGTVARFEWDGSASLEELDRCAEEARKADANVRYTLFKGDTVVPPTEHPGPGSNHTCTWRIAYQIPAIRDWLFTNSNGETEHGK